MKTSSFLLACCLSLFTVCGCQRQSAKTPPAGSFRLEVEDIVKDENFRVVSFQIFSKEPGWAILQKKELWASECAAQLLRPPADKLWGTHAFVLVGKAGNTANANALIQVTLKLESKGGDGNMLVNGNFGSSGGATYTVAANASLDQFVNASVRSGIYPIGQPLVIGSVDGHPITLTLGKEMPTVNPRTLSQEFKAAEAK
jgi:hypothetical protein